MRLLFLITIGMIVGCNPGSDNPAKNRSGNESACLSQRSLDGTAAEIAMQAYKISQECHLDEATLQEFSEK